MKSQGSPRNYESFAAFEREELRPLNRVGFSVADLEAEAIYKAFDEQIDNTNDELDFG